MGSQPRRKPPKIQSKEWRKRARSTINEKCPTTGKWCYSTKKRAAEAAARVNHDNPRSWLNEYPCPDCKHWHIGHPTGLNTVPTEHFDPKTGRNTPPRQVGLSDGAD